MGKRSQSELEAWDYILLWMALVLWLAIFVAGTVINSEPFRNRFASFTGGLAGTLESGVIVMLTYTFTNVAFLCVLASILGMLGAKAVLDSDARAQEQERDTTSPRHSAVLRGFFVYLLLVAGVLVLSEDPAGPTQSEYVRLAGLISLLAFMVNYRPSVCGRLLDCIANWASDSRRLNNAGYGASAGAQSSCSAGDSDVQAPQQRGMGPSEP